MTKTQQEIKTYSAIFENSDFNDGANARKWWEKEFEEASTKNAEQLKSWAEFMLDYLDDFAESVYYLRDEVRDFLEEIKEGAR